MSPKATTAAASPRRADAPAKRTLSSKIQSMKFMKRGQEKEKLEEQKRKGQQQLSEACWKVVYDDSVLSNQKTTGPRVLYESSYLAFPSTVGADADSPNAAMFGRQSFQRFNPAVDRIAIETRERLKEEATERELEKINLSDEAMAQSLARDRHKDRQSKDGESSPSDSAPTITPNKRKRTAKVNSE
ncbi:hypothetical protein EV182_005675 [Spiromyces aspiralis]|uniref:Uncharacterized protein n=1 Tax=Spiromyces aspiralis TaxID=68401 RepID=A0ACC1HN93_9FUNG|nr:hypothetical protein EV182_005675 [Spiromyces aspiralis]